MKHHTTYALPGSLLLLAVFQVGCWSPRFNQAPVAASITPISAENVKLFKAGNGPKTGYEVVSPLSCEGYTKDKYEGPMREAAGRIGADAVINIHNFTAPRVLGARYQSGIAVRTLGNATAQPASEAKSAVAIVVLIEFPVKDSDELMVLLDTIELFAAANLHFAGYCPIHVHAKFPSGKDAPSRNTFDLLKQTEASVCEKMLVLRLLRRDQRFEMLAQLHSRHSDEAIWTAERQASGFDASDLFDLTPVVILKALNAKSSTMVYKVVNKTLRGLPKNR